MKYTIYTLSTGKIEKTVNCPPELLDIQFDSSVEGFIEGSFNDTGYYVVESTPVAFPEKPTEHHKFDFSAKQWIDPRTQESEWLLVRAERDRRLLSCDWTQLPDVPLATKEAWATYRQALRDITEQPDPFNITWPVVPG